MRSQTFLIPVFPPPYYDSVGLDEHETEDDLKTPTIENVLQVFPKIFFFLNIFQMILVLRLELETNYPSAQHNTTIQLPTDEKSCSSFIISTFVKR